MEIALLIIVIFLVAALGVLGFQRAATQARLKESVRQLAEAQHKLEDSQASLKEAEVDKAAHKASLEALTKTHEDLAISFKGIAAEVTKENSETFLRQAKEQFESHQKLSDASLKERQVAIDELVKPIKKNLEDFERQVVDMEKDRKEAYGGLQSEVGALSTTAENLKKALQSTNMRGQWGELQLRNVLELSGLHNRFSFDEQVTLKKDGKSIRPDVVVNIPGDLKVVIDAKTPLDAYQNAHAEVDDKNRQELLKAHAEALWDRVKELSNKGYLTHFDNTPEFVLLFLPADPILDAAMDVKPTLWEDAWEKHGVIIATPGLLLAFLKTVAFAWQRQDLERNAEKIEKGATELYNKLKIYLRHVERIGKGLTSAVNAYNDSIGSLEGRGGVLPRARKFEELGVASKSQQISPPTSVGENVRSLTAPELSAPELSSPELSTSKHSTPEIFTSELETESDGGDFDDF